MSGTTLEARIQSEIRKRLKRTQGKRDRAALLMSAMTPTRLITAALVLLCLASQARGVTWRIDAVREARGS